MAILMGESRSLIGAQVFLQQCHHFTRLGMSADCFLGEDEGAIDRNFERAPRRLLEAELRARNRFLELGYQTGSPGSVVSDHAVFDGDMHGDEPIPNPSLCQAESQCHFPGAGYIGTVLTD
jgi:hypothetical protein